MANIEGVTLAPMIKQTYFDDGPEISLVQNRLTAAGLVLAVLFFSGSFTIGVYGQWTDTKSDYRFEFPQIEVAIALGACLTLLTIGALLLCQQLPQTESNSPCFKSRRWWFAASTVWLYLSLTQAMSAGLTEVVFGLSFKAQFAATAVAYAATPVWFFLLIAAPLHLVLRLWTHFTRGERISLVAAYLLPLLLILCLPAEVYRLQNSEPQGLAIFAKEFLLQIIQPVTWAQPWIE